MIFHTTQTLLSAFEEHAIPDHPSSCGNDTYAHSIWHTSTITFASAHHVAENQQLFVEITRKQRQTRTNQSYLKPALTWHRSGCLRSWAAVVTGERELAPYT